MSTSPAHPARRFVRRFDPWRRSLFALFLLLVCWRFSLPADESPFIQFVAAANARDGFQIVEPTTRPVIGEKFIPKYDTFAHRVLNIDSEEGYVSPEHYALLDSIIDDARNRVHYDAAIKEPKAQREQAEQVLRVIDQVLTDHNVLYPPGDYDVDSLRAGLTAQHYDKGALERILRVPINKRRRAHARANVTGSFYILDCDTSSFVYVGIADVIGVDLHLVDLPDHMFVRWPLSDGTYVNWDTNYAEIVPDKEFVRDYSLGKRIRRQRVYLATMTQQEAEGFAYFLRAMRYEDHDENARAIADLLKARELYPQSTQVAAELAWLYATTDGVDDDRRKQAIVLAQSAVDLEPKCGDFWDSLAAAEAANGDFKQAVKDARKAEDLAESAEDRGEFKAHRKAFERGEMPVASRSQAK